MPKLLVLYCNPYEHIEAMAGAIAEGACEVPYTAVTIKRIPELVSEEVARKPISKLDLRALATVDELPEYDAIIIGASTHFGNMCAQMANFFEQTSNLWIRGALIGKVGSVFASAATQPGGQETTIISMHTTLLHHGMIIVGMPYGAQDLVNIDEVTGGTPCGARTPAKADGPHNPIANAMELARLQGRHVAGITAKLTAASGSRPVMLW